MDTNYSSWGCGKEATSETCNNQKCYTRCDETYTTKVCEQYSDWPIQYHYYKYDKRDNSLCESWWSNESCSLNGGPGSSETKCQCVTPAVSTGACYCASSGDPGTSGVIEYHWTSSTGQGLCCCIPAGCKW